MRNNRKSQYVMKVSSDSLTDQEAKNKLHDKFTAFQVNKELAVEAYRTAAKTKLNADIKKAETEQQMIGLLEMAGEHFEEVRREPFWLVYQKEGAIVFENPFNERDLRNSIRMHRAQLEKQIDSLSDEGNNDLYEDSSD